ncbi:MAG: hypothetical protein AMJ90_05035 [candidate division Zixibacteria bacterium SM23_73_2]|nr:MAG: hypothetical protein AMJ90_05035 [candidate division Zixibacteria bacterium SM23_73_2]
MTANNNKLFSKANLFQFLFAFFVTAFGIITAYHTAIFGIKLDLAKKAESEIVNQLDKKLSKIEILLNEKLLTKDEFYQFKDQMDKRLTRIEYKFKIKK